MRIILHLVLLVVCLLGGGIKTYSQTQLGTGSISGTIQDSAGATIAGATVTVSDPDTGLNREITTGDDGQFNVPVLPSGDYTVRVEQSGFAALEQQNVVVTVGRATTLRLELQPGGIGETVNITSDAPVIDATKTEETTLINRTQINDLPINGRRADQFALLAPGVTRDGRFGLLSYRGQSGVFNNFTLEGNDDNQAYFAEARGRTRIASNVSANAIREFQVGQSNFLPEFGRSAGGGINSVIRSGTNTFSGDGFYYFRNQGLNARDPLSTIKPAERREQFGGSVSGPIKQDKLFFFVNYDQQLRNFPLIIEDLSNVLTGGRPTLASNATAAQQAQFARDTAAFNLGAETARSRFPGGAPGNTIPRTANQNLFLTKVDWNINQANTFSATYNYLNARGQNAIQTPLVLGNVGRNGSDDVRINTFNARLTTIVSSRAVNEFRFQASRDLEFQFGNEPPPQVFVGGFSFGLANFLERPALPDERRLQFVNNFSYVIGRHSLKFGGDINRARDIINNPRNFGGTYSYSNALLFGRDLIANRDGLTNQSGFVPSYSSFTQNFGLPGLDFSTVDYAVFAQDQWRARNNLTINYGLRYDFQNVPSPIAPNPDIPETLSVPEYKGNFGPRIGIAYDIAGSGRTVIRGGYGWYYGRTPNGTIFNALTQTGLLDPTLNTIGLTLRPGDPGAPIYPNVLSELPSTARGSTDSYRLDPDFKQPRMQELNIGVERQLANNLSVSASYIYTKGDRLPVGFDTNLPEPAFTRAYQLPDGTTFDVPFSAGITRTAAGVAQNINLSRPNPNFGSLIQQRSIGETYYNGLLVEVKRRFANNYQFNVAYTLAKAENLSGAADGGGSGPESPFSGSNLQNQFDLDANRAPSPTDQRHRLVLNGVFNLPQVESDSRLVRALLNGYRLSGIYTAETGRPFAALVTVPNLPFAFNGAQYNGFGGLLGQGGGSDRNLAPNIGRNSNYGEANYRADLRLARDIRLTERLVFELIGEGFNIFNTSNFNGFRTTRYEAAATTVGTSLTAPIVLTERPDFGIENNNSSQPDGTNARRFQLAARFRF